jgi:hypothetical protein
MLGAARTQCAQDCTLEAECITIFGVVSTCGGALY